MNPERGRKPGNLVFGDCWPQEGMNHIGFPRYKAKRVGTLNTRGRRGLF